jgi:membrane associated rhomboid family serine protease
MSLASPSSPSASGDRVRLGPFGPPLLLLIVMWVLELVDVVLRGSLDSAGIAARDTDGLVGILAAPFLHAGFSHLIANTVPLMILGTLVSLHGRGTFWRVTAAVVVLGGLGTWLISSAGSVTIGASGLVFGYLGYLLVAGLRTGHWLDLIVGFVVFLVYGGLLAGALPWAVGAQVSWQAHLCGALAGVAAAWWWPPLRAPSRSG